MSKSTVEIDFFQMEKQNASARAPTCSSYPSSRAAGGHSFPGIQSLVSRISPRLLKTVMAASSPGGKQAPLTSPRMVQVPAFDPAASRGTAASQLPSETAPLTIFYNGTVAVFDVPRDLAEVIIRMAETGIAESPAPRKEKEETSSLVHSCQLEGDLPIARRKSLRRFLQKRKDRLMTVRPRHPTPVD